MTLVQGSNGSLSLPGEMLVMDRIRITYESYLFRDFYHVFCLVVDGMYCNSTCISRMRLYVAS